MLHLQKGIPELEAIYAKRSGDESAGSGSNAESVFSAQSQHSPLTEIAGAIRSILDKLDVPASAGIKAKKKRKLGKRETVIFAAILMEFTGTKYCSFLQDHGIKPKSSDSGPATYLLGYKAGDPWRKKIQDEKTRAKRRIGGYDLSELATALSTYLPQEFDKQLFHSALAQLEKHE